MKTVACMLLLVGALSADLSAGAPRGAKVDFCVCGGCAGFKHREAIGVCATCKGGNLTIDDKTCGECAGKASACMHCGKRLRNPKVLVGEAFLVDKQPRADLAYYVVKGEDGTSQGLYVDPARTPPVKGRTVIFASQDEKGDLIARGMGALAPKEKDLEVKGESDGPVIWQSGEIVSSEAAPKDGKFTLVLPAAPYAYYEVRSGGKVLSRHRCENGVWKEPR